MNSPIISIIAAIGSNRELGKNNALLWHISEDLKRFKKLTQGHTVIMGRKTYESLPGPLPDRLNIIVTANPDYSINDSINQSINTKVKVCMSLHEAISYAKQKEKNEIFIIGGGEIYRQAIKLSDKLYLTLVEGTYDADTFFPDYSEFSHEIFRKESEQNGTKFVFLELMK